MQAKDRAICLLAVNYSDTSQVVTLLCRAYGKIGAIAKGSRRVKSAFDGPIEVFSHGDVIFIVKESGGLAMLTEFNQQPHFRTFSQNLDVLNAALFGAELTEHFLEENDPHPELFDIFIAFLQTLQESKAEREILGWLILYQIRLLEETGIAPVWDKCTNCSTTLSCVGTAHPTRNHTDSFPSVVYFSSRNNGLLCSACETAFVEKRIVSMKMADILQHPAKLPKTDAALLKEIEQLLIYHFTEQLGNPPRLAKYFS
jgi:DNA repair protein RecO